MPVMAVKPTIGILAGGGSLPREIADAVRADGGRVHVVALDGEANPSDFPAADVTVVNWGQIGRMLRALRAAGAEKLVIVGRVKRPDLSRLKTDLGFFTSLPAIIRIMASGGDDGVLRGVVRFFEGHGLRVVGPADVAPSLVVSRGPLGSQGLPAGLGPDIALGFDIIRRLGPFDIGQAVVVRNGRVIAIEAAEGTDAMLDRLATPPREMSDTRQGILIKRPKPGQERRVDMPAIGPDTVSRAAAAGLQGIVVEAGGALAADRVELIRRADTTRIFVAGVDDTWMPGSRREVTAAAGQPVPAIGGRASRQDLTDANMAIRVCQALEPELVSAGVVVVRGHVLAVEAGEGRTGILQRSARLRQWGRAKTRKKRGALAVMGPSPLVIEEIAASADAGLAVVAAGGPILAQNLLAAAKVQGIVVAQMAQMAPTGTS